MKIRFENVGRFKRTWEADYPFPPNPNRCQLFGRTPLFMIVCNRQWWLQQLKAAGLTGEIVLEYIEEDDRVDIRSGWQTVGTARAVQEEAPE